MKGIEYIKYSTSSNLRWRLGGWQRLYVEVAYGSVVCLVGVGGGGRDGLGWWRLFRMVEMVKVVG
jgi:hypothetical protein